MAHVAECPGWKRSLALRKTGTPFPDERNVRIALNEAPELKGILQYDEFSDSIELTRPLPGMPRDALNALFRDDEPMPWRDIHVSELVMWLTEQGMIGLRRNVVQDTVIAVAQRHAYHPVRSYLAEGIPGWDAKPRPSGWLAQYLGATDDPDYLAAVGPKFLIGAAARAMEPGCQMDSILVLEGEQGVANRP